MPEPILRGIGLSVAYGGVTALADVDLVLKAGEVLGLIGPNGAGKTSCIDGVSGFALMTGSLELDGSSISRLPAHRRRTLGLSRTWQSLGVFDDLTLLENVTIAAHSRRGHHEARAQLARVGLAKLADRLPGEISHGQRVLVGIARALVDEPRVLLMDEPAAGLDDQESGALEALVRQIADEGTAVLLVEHDMNLVMRVCDRLHVLDFGRTVAEGMPEQVAHEPAVIAAYIGMPGGTEAGTNEGGGPE